MNLRNLFHRHPRRRVVDPMAPILRYYAGDVLHVFRARLECGHLIHCDETRPRVRRCWKCSRGLPADSRVRVRAGHRRAVTA